MELQNDYIYYEFYANVFPSLVLWHFNSKAIGQGPVSVVIDKNTENMLFSVFSVS